MQAEKDPLSSRSQPAGLASRPASTSRFWAARRAVLHGADETVDLFGSRSRRVASVAQLAEQLICNQQVAGSTPAASSRRSWMIARRQTGSVDAEPEVGSRLHNGPEPRLGTGPRHN